MMEGQFDEPYSSSYSANNNSGGAAPVDPLPPSGSASNNGSNGDGIVRGPAFDIQNLNNPTGLLSFVNVIVLFLASCIMGGWRGEVFAPLWMLTFNDGSTFFLVSTLIPFFLLIALILLMVFGFKEYFRPSLFALVIFVNCAFWGFLLLISSGLVMGKSNYLPCNHWYCSHLLAAGAFGFLGVVLFIVEGVFNFLIWRRER
eukprot:TCONS_00029609-protein